jgi:hypothetical protein
MGPDQRLDLLGRDGASAIVGDDGEKRGHEGP